MKPAGKISFGVLVTDVTRLMRKHFDRRAVRFNLTRAQWRALKRLHRGEGMRQNELAEQLEMEPIAIADPADRRAWRLYLMPRAHGVVGDMEQISTELFRKAQRGISAADMKAMMGMLTRMKDNLNALDESGA